MPNANLNADIFNWHDLFTFVKIDSVDTVNSWADYARVFLGITTTVALAYWISSAVPGMDMAVALLLLATPTINWIFITSVIVQLLYRGRSASPLQRSRKMPKYL